MPILRSDRGQGLLIMPWQLTDVAMGGRRLLIRYAAGGGCAKPVGVQLTETAETVVIAPRSRSTAKPGAACTTNLIVGFGYIDLQRPLAHRKLVHPAPSKGWAGVL